MAIKYHDFVFSSVRTKWLIQGVSIFIILIIILAITFLATQENKNWDVVIIDSLLLTDLQMWSL